MADSEATARKKQREREDLLQGTLDMIVLQTLLFGPMHGHAIATSIEKTSENVLQVDHGSLYPALHRLLRRGWIASAWGVSQNNRRAKYYRLTAGGRKQLVVETTKWERLVRAIARIAQASPQQE
ncbi:MAG: PadR family transcriptional regulator [Acidobacteriota bacterium]|jgi:transcriptional regulator